MAHPTFWTKERRRLLKELWCASDVTMAQIMARFGCTETRLNAERNRLGLQVRSYYDPSPAPGKWTREQTDILYREWQRGTGVELIALMTGKTRAQVIWKRQYCGLEPRRPQKGARTEKCVIYIPKDVKARLDAAAASMKMSRAGYVARLISREFTRGRDRWTGAAPYAISAPDHGGQPDATVQCQPASDEARRQ